MPTKQTDNDDDVSVSSRFSLKEIALKIGRVRDAATSRDEEAKRHTQPSFQSRNLTSASRKSRKFSLQAIASKMSDEISATERPTPLNANKKTTYSYVPSTGTYGAARSRASRALSCVDTETGTSSSRAPGYADTETGKSPKRFESSVDTQTGTNSNRKMGTTLESPTAAQSYQDRVKAADEALERLRAQLRKHRPNTRATTKATESRKYRFEQEEAAELQSSSTKDLTTQLTSSVDCSTMTLTMCKEDQASTFSCSTTKDAQASTFSCSTAKDVHMEQELRLAAEDKIAKLYMKISDMDHKLAVAEEHCRKERKSKQEVQKKVVKLENNGCRLSTEVHQANKAKRDAEEKMVKMIERMSEMDHNLASTEEKLKAALKVHIRDNEAKAALSKEVKELKGKLKAAEKKIARDKKHMKAVKDESESNAKCIEMMRQLVEEKEKEISARTKEWKAKEELICAEHAQAKQGRKRIEQQAIQLQQRAQEKDKRLKALKEEQRTQQKSLATNALQNKYLLSSLEKAREQCKKECNRRMAAESEARSLRNQCETLSKAPPAVIPLRSKKSREATIATSSASMASWTCASVDTASVDTEGRKPAEKALLEKDESSASNPKEGTIVNTLPSDKGGAKKVEEGKDKSKPEVTKGESCVCATPSDESDCTKASPKLNARCTSSQDPSPNNALYLKEDSGDQTEGAKAGKNDQVNPADLKESPVSSKTDIDTKETRKIESKHLQDKAKTQEVKTSKEVVELHPKKKESESDEDNTTQSKEGPAGVVSESVEGVSEIAVSPPKSLTPCKVESEAIQSQHKEEAQAKKEAPPTEVERTEETLKLEDQAKEAIGCVQQDQKVEEAVAPGKWSSMLAKTSQELEATANKFKTQEQEAAAEKVHIQAKSCSSERKDEEEQTKQEDTTAQKQGDSGATTNPANQMKQEDSGVTTAPPGAVEEQQTFAASTLKNEESLLASVPIHIKDMYQKVGFFKDRKLNEYFPVLCLRPFSMPPGPAQVQVSSEPSDFLGVYIYGKSSFTTAYQSIKWFRLIPYEAAVKKGLNKVPEHIEAKLENNISLAPWESELYQGLEQVKAEAAKDPAERAHPFLQFQQESEDRLASSEFETESSDSSGGSSIALNTEPQVESIEQKEEQQGEIGLEEEALSKETTSHQVGTGIVGAKKALPGLIEMFAEDAKQVEDSKSVEEFEATEVTVLPVRTEDSKPPQKTASSSAEMALSKRDQVWREESKDIEGKIIDTLSTLSECLPGCSYHEDSILCPQSGQSKENESLRKAKEDANEIGNATKSIDSEVDELEVAPLGSFQQTFSKTRQTFSAMLQQFSSSPISPVIKSDKKTKKKAPLNPPESPRPPDLPKFIVAEKMEGECAVSEIGNGEAGFLVPPMPNDADKLIFMLQQILGDDHTPNGENDNEEVLKADLEKIQSLSTTQREEILDTVGYPSDEFKLG